MSAVSGPPLNSTPRSSEMLKNRSKAWNEEA